MTTLFDPFALRGMTARNRIWLAPMCQYSAFACDGQPTDWHLVHLGARATGGFGLVMAEATAVVPEGRISPQDTGLWSDDHIESWRRVTAFVREQGAVPAIQLAHAGRKASTWSPLVAERGSVPEPEGGWTTQAPSALAYDDLAEPSALTREEIHGIVRAFGAAAGRAVDAGFEAIEIHAAHGYLLHEFLSPLSNQRTDEYGGTFENRVRIVHEVVDAMRATLPDTVPLFVRFSGTDWVDGGWSIEDTVAVSRALAERGVDLVDVSSGGLAPEQQIPVAPGFQVPLAAQVRAGADVATGAVGLITEPHQAQRILDAGEADVVLLARSGLREPAWPLRAARELGVERDAAPYPPQYVRGAWPR